MMGCEFVYKRNGLKKAGEICGSKKCWEDEGGVFRCNRHRISVIKSSHLLRQEKGRRYSTDQVNRLIAKLKLQMKAIVGRHMGWRGYVTEIVQNEISNIKVNMETLEPYKGCVVKIPSDK